MNGEVMALAALGTSLLIAVTRTLRSRQHAHRVHRRDLRAAVPAKPEWR